MLYLRLQVVAHRVLLKPVFVSEIFDHVMVLLGAEVGLLVGDLLLSHSSSSLSVCLHLVEDVLLVGLVGL